MLLWFNGEQFTGELMKPAKRKAPMTQNPVYNKETPPPSLPQQASRSQRFSALAAKYTLQDVIKSATKEMNPTATLLIMIATVLRVTMKCTPDHPKH